MANKRPEIQGGVEQESRRHSSERERQTVSQEDVGTLRVQDVVGEPIQQPPGTLPDNSGRLFTCKEDFFSDETRSQYVHGLSYTSRSAEMDQLVEAWVAEGKVTWGGPQAKVAASGEATGGDQKD